MTNTPENPTQLLACLERIQILSYEAAEHITRLLAHRSRAIENELDHLGDLCIQLQQTSTAALATLQSPLPNTTSTSADPHQVITLPVTRPEVLWIDNDALHLSLLKGYLVDRGFDVVTADTVEEALLVINRQAFGGYILDLLIPTGSIDPLESAGGRLTGLALARRIRKLHPDTPIVFLTILNEESVVQWCDANPPAVLVSKSALLNHGLDELERTLRSQVAKPPSSLYQLLTRFPLFVRLLATRGRGRLPFTVSDEHDVHTLLAALLSVLYENVRSEESTPSYAATSSRIDFLIPAYNLAIEVKMLQQNTAISSIVDQLIVDAERYRHHPLVKHLCCFVYDPHHVITNPALLVSDLSSRRRGGLALSVVIAQQ